MKKDKKNKQKLQEEGAGVPAPLPLPPVVRVRMLRKAFTAWGFMEPGRVVRVPAHVAKHWIAEGISEQDKALDGAPEMK
jgi:hypothetical protein